MQAVALGQAPAQEPVPEPVPVPARPTARRWELEPGPGRERPTSMTELAPVRACHPRSHRRTRRRCRSRLQTARVLEPEPELVRQLVSPPSGRTRQPQAPARARWLPRGAPEPVLEQARQTWTEPEPGPGCRTETEPGPGPGPERQI